MGEKSPVQLYRKLFFIDTAVIVCVVAALASYFLSVVSRNARESSLNYMQMVCDNAETYLKKSADTADYVMNGLYRSGQELDDLMHYMEDEREDYLRYRLDAFTESNSDTYDGIDDFAESTMSAFPDIESLRFLSYGKGEMTTYLPEGKSYLSVDRDELFEDVQNGALSQEGSVSFLKEIRDPKTLQPGIGCMIVDFGAGKFEEAQSLFPRAVLLVEDAQGENVFSSVREEETQEILAAWEKAAGNTELERLLNAYVRSAEAGGCRVLAFLSKAGAGKFSVALFLTILGFSAALIAAGEVLLFGYLKRLTGRLNRILTGMEQVTRGNLDVRLQTGKRMDELDVISGHFNQMCGELDRYIEKSYRAELEQKNAEMAALQSQINPHFLYNTLEAIRMKAICNKDREVGKMLYSLAVLFRSQIKEADVITLAQELHYCKKYLELFEFRYQGKLKTNVECPERFMQVPVIKFIVQPIIENYFEHGIRMEAADNRLDIYVEGAGKGGEMILSVRDNGRGMSGEEIALKNRELSKNAGDNRGSIGLTNVNRRMKAAYGMSYGVLILENEGGGLCIMLKFPWLKEEDHEEGNAGRG